MRPDQRDLSNRSELLLFFLDVSKLYSIVSRVKGMGAIHQKFARKKVGDTEKRAKH